MTNSATQAAAHSADIKLLIAALGENLETNADLTSSTWGHVGDLHEAKKLIARAAYQLGAITHKQAEALTGGRI